MPRLVGSGDVASQMANPLRQKLDAAAKAWAKGDCKTAANIYGAFANFVHAQDGKKIDEMAASILVGDANYLASHCP